MKHFLFQKKIVPATLIILTGILGSIFIFGILGTPKERGVSVISSEIDSTSNLNFFRTDLPNLTEEFTNKSVEAVVSNPDFTEKEITLPNEKEVNSIIDEIIEKDLETEYVDVSEISVISNASKKLEMGYVLVIEQILQDGLKGGALDSRRDSVTQYFEDVADRAELNLDVLNSMRVPELWIATHAKVISFFKKQKNIYSSLSQAEFDPLRFIIASTRVSKEIEDGLKEIEESIEKGIEIMSSS